MAKLTDIGFLKGAIVETIVSTYDVDGQPNAAPMGAIMENEQRIIITLFNSSLTCKNLQANKCAVVNVTSEVEIFYRTAFKETNPNGTLPRDWFEKAETVNAPRLRMANATIEVSATALTPIGTEKTAAQCDVKLVKAAETLPKAFNRALPATLEAIIHATRVQALISNEQEQEHVAQLLSLIENCADVVNRVASNSRYSEIMADLAKRIDSWRANK